MPGQRKTNEEEDAWIVEAAARGLDDDQIAAWFPMVFGRPMHRLTVRWVLVRERSRPGAGLLEVMWPREHVLNRRWA